MNNLRFKALEKIAQQEYVAFSPKMNRLDSFAANVFDERKLQNYLSKPAFKEMMLAIKKGTQISRSLAEQIAQSMKLWALENGATHYTHWFQPLTGATAEKHESFLDFAKDGRVISALDGSQLVQQEPDASSFPSGGIRNTFEARGYTAWDPTSPAFLFGKTLCIPTIFVSYTGEALDYKTPLLRSISAVDHASTEICKFFDKTVTKVIPTLGWEQEYFLVDRMLMASRPDLILTGRTLLGHSSAKGQQLDDHYFGSIPTRMLSFMNELEEECALLGIPVKTRHNEVAPSQFELAPIFEEANLSVDHNALLIDVMKRTAEKHNLEVLFHEKPFAGINGSGKHNNWSLATNTGVNLLSPGKTPMSNLQFLTFFVNTIAAVHQHQNLLCASMMSASNDHRLGANEAPPTIMSVFIGKQLTKVLNDLAQVSEGKLSPQEKTDLKLNVVGKIPEILLDNTDRNRTSPFAFTGNKFEFRAVGSKANCAKPMTVLNTIVANQLQAFKEKVDALMDKDAKMKKDDAIFNELRDLIKQIKPILFEGDGYSENWIKDAKKRGLNQASNTPEALKAYVSPESIALFTKQNVLGERELEARLSVDLEQFTLALQIEGRTLGDLARNHIIPTAINYLNTLIENVRGLKEIYGDEFKDKAKEQMLLIERISSHIAEINSGVNDMIEKRKNANLISDDLKKALAYCNDVKPCFETIRYHCDKLELLVDNSLWPLAKYRELLFAH
ncbi:glutamine synthetase III [Flavobacteriaceae bacterium]|nr:glutamine synthetase III [Flavobacteriaceae bacterium]MDC1060739.1 glutamine synthetase III [Flavobacteriaceae bacterium]